MNIVRIELNQHIDYTVVTCKQVLFCILENSWLADICFLIAPSPFLSFCSFHGLYPSLSYFLLHAFYLSMPPSPIWQALSCARVTLALRSPQKVREGTEKNQPPFSFVLLFVTLSHRNTHTHAHTHTCYIIYRSCVFPHYCVFCIGVHIVYLHIRYFYANRAFCVCVCMVVCPLAEAMLVLALADRWGTERLFIFAEEFAL